MLFAIIDESVLHRLIGSPQIMRDQLAHLLEMATRSNIRVQVIPEETGGSSGLPGAFMLASPHSGPDVVYLESYCKGRVTAHPDDVSTMANRYDDISADALPKQASLALISKVLEERWKQS